MRLTLDRALKYRAEKIKRPRIAIDRGKIIGGSPAITRCLDLLGRAAEGDVTVLLTGETGTGKELFARAIHENSPRSENPMVVVDCTVLPEQLMEGILFGHVKGAFTGADAGKDGLIRQAHGGTLFLDEVGELPLDLQKKFLRVLQEQAYRPLGSRDEIKSDFRLIAATNKKLEDMTVHGGFREDLYYRLKSFIIELPPLRDRREDIVPLSIHHLDSLCRRYGLPPKEISAELCEALASYTWPGNVRELLNTMDRILAVARHEPTLYPFHLPANIRMNLAGVRSSSERTFTDTRHVDGKTSVDVSRPLKDVRDEAVRKLEEEYLKRLLDETGGDMKEASRRSGLARSQFYSLVKKYGIGRTE
jgi:two-component system NtrC family response regulator